MCRNKISTVVFAQTNSTIYYIYKYFEQILRHIEDLIKIIRIYVSTCSCLGCHYLNLYFLQVSRIVFKTSTDFSVSVICGHNVTLLVFLLYVTENRIK